MNIMIKLFFSVVVLTMLLCSKMDCVFGQETRGSGTSRVQPLANNGGSGTVGVRRAPSGVRRSTTTLPPVLVLGGRGTGGDQAALGISDGNTKCRNGMIRDAMGICREQVDNDDITFE